MNYLHDRKAKKRKNLLIGIVGLLFIVLIFFSVITASESSSVAHTIFRPILMAGNGLGDRFANLRVFFESKNYLLERNEELQLKLLEFETQKATLAALTEENNDLKEILGRKSENKEMVLAGILAKPNRSAYDTLLIDAGEVNGVRKGALVFALGNIPIGKVAEVYPNSAKVVLFSSPNQKTEGVISGRDVFMELLGRGGGNFSMILPHNFSITKGEQVLLPGVNSYVVAVVDSTISDPRDAFQRALLTAPVNLFELRFVQVEK